jgi:hypothetical protein
VELGFHMYNVIRCCVINQGKRENINMKRSERHRPIYLEVSAPAKLNHLKFDSISAIPVYALLSERSTHAIACLAH